MRRAIFLSLVTACHAPVYEGVGSDGSSGSTSANSGASTDGDSPATTEPQTTAAVTTEAGTTASDGTTSASSTADPTTGGTTTGTTAEPGSTTGTTEPPAPVCGDGSLAGDEECDDGANEDGDGCSAECVKEFRYVFVTGDVYGSDLGGLAGADEKCQEAAAVAGLPGEYAAWLSDGNESPASRFVHSTIPYVRVDKVEVAKDWTDLTDGTLAAGISVSEAGGMAGLGTHPCMPGDALIAWTNTNETGAAANKQNTCGDWEGGDGDAGWGRAGVTNSAWTGFCSGACAGAQAALYCFEQ